MTPLHAELRPDVRRLVDHLKRSRTDQTPEQLALDPAIYRDEEVARLERERVFGRAPVAVAHASELTAGDAGLTMRLPNHEATLVRGADGVVSAVVDGDALPAEERHGLVWVVDSPTARIDVAGWLGPAMDAVIASYDLDRYVCFRFGAFEQPVNWKLLQDAFLDGYHLQFVHPQTAARVIYNNVLVLDDFGRHSRFASARKSLHPLIRDGAPACTEEDIARHINLAHGLLPNATLLVVPDHVELLSFFPHPSDPGRSRMEMRVLVEPLRDGDDEDAWRRHWERNWKILIDVLCEEDFPVLRQSHRALQSMDAGPLLLGRNEVGNHVFHRELAKLLA